MKLLVTAFHYTKGISFIYLRYCNESMSQVTFRRYSLGDEEGIVKVMNEAFSTFKNFGLTPEVWKSYAEIDEGFKLENALVAELEHKIVGHVQLVERDLKVGERTFVKNGGIANVCTLPKARGKGVSTGLMKLAVEISKENGYPMSTLFTGYGGVAHRVYRSVGYADTFFPPYLVGSVEEMKLLQDRTRDVEGVKIRDFKDDDEEKLLDVYELSSTYYTGVVRRTKKYWRKKLTERSSTHSFFFEKFDPDEVIVAEENGEVTGYSYLTFWKRKEKPFQSTENGSIREIVFKPGCYRTFLKLVNESINRMLSEGVKTLNLSIPFDRDYLTLFDDFKVFVTEGIFMTNITNMNLLIDSMEEEFNERLSSDIEGVTSNVSFNLKTLYGSVPIRIKGGEVQVKEESSEAEVEINYHSFTRMVFGIETFSEAITNKKARVKGVENIQQIVSTLDIMFPQMVWHIWPVDHW